jgi:hypothetical protein
MRGRRGKEEINRQWATIIKDDNGDANSSSSGDEVEGEEGDSAVDTDDSDYYYLAK